MGGLTRVCSLHVEERVGGPSQLQLRARAARSASVRSVMATKPLWGQLLCTGLKEAEPNREIDLTVEEILIGRKDGCHILYAKDNTISSVHCKLSITRAGEDDEDATVAVQQPFTTWIEDCSSNGTFLNSDRLKKGQKVQLQPNDTIGLTKPCGGAEQPPYGFIFKVAPSSICRPRTFRTFCRPPTRRQPSPDCSPAATPSFRTCAPPPPSVRRALPLLSCIPAPLVPAGLVRKPDRRGRPGYLPCSRPQPAHRVNRSATQDGAEGTAGAAAEACDATTSRATGSHPTALDARPERARRERPSDS